MADRALAIGEMALETLEEARQAAANAEAIAAQADAKVDAAPRDMAEAVQVAREADGLAFLALFTAEQALIRLDEVDKQLRTRPVISGEIRSTFEQANASEASVPRDPRGGGAGDVHDGVTAVTSSVTVRAALEPVDGVKVVGDVKLSGGRQGYTLSADVPFSFGTAVLEKGFSRSAANPANFTDSASFGVKDVDLVGFALGAKFSATTIRTAGPARIASS